MHKILQTTNFDKFRDIRGNREINREHLKKLSNSILDNNMLDLNPIIVNEKMEVLDGQHRLLACKTLGIPVSYIVAENGGIKEVRMLNSNVRNWTMKNYLDSYISRGMEEYIKIQKFMDKTGSTLGVSILLLTGNLSKSSQSVTDGYRNGDFKASQEEYAYEMIKKITELSKFCEDDCYRNREFISALGFVYRSGYSHKDLLEKMIQSHAKFVGLQTRKQYIRKFEDILSWKQKVSVRLI